MLSPLSFDGDFTSVRLYGHFLNFITKDLECQFCAVAFIGVYMDGAFETLVLEASTLPRITYQLLSARLRVHVVINTNRLFSAEAWRRLGQVTRLCMFLLTGSMVETVVGI